MRKKVKLGCLHLFKESESEWLLLLYKLGAAVLLCGLSAVSEILA